MGAPPRLQIRHLEEEAGLAALSINLELRVGMSKQMMSLAPGLGYPQEF
jgi:DNA polymerase V